MSQQKLAEMLGVRRATISEWERGIRNPALSLHQIKTMESLLSGIGLSFNDLPDDLSTGRLEK